MFVWSSPRLCVKTARNRLLFFAERLSRNRLSSIVGGLMSLLMIARNPDWIGCVDFGTALSKVALTRRMPRSGLTEKDIVALAIGVRDGLATTNPFLLPSIAYVTDQALLFGQE